MCMGGSWPLWVVVLICVGSVPGMVFRGGRYLVVGAGKGTYRGGRALVHTSAKLKRNTSQSVHYNLLHSTAITKLIEKYPNGWSLYAIRARKYSKEGNIDGALNDLQIYFSHTEETPLDLMLLKGIIHDSMFDFDAAIQSFTAAIQICTKPTRGCHEFYIEQAKKPRTCLQCGGKIAAAKYIGCNNCLTITHPECIVEFNAPCCSGNNKHEIISRKIHVPTHCASCNGALSRLSGVVSYCIFCGNVVHKKCLDNFDKVECKSSQTPFSCSISDVYNCRGLAYYHNSKYDEALNDFTVAIDLYTGDEKQKCSLFANRGLTLFYIAKYELSISDLTSAITGGMNISHLYAMRASAYQIIGMEDEAQKDWYAAHALDTQIITNVFPYPLPFDVIGVILACLDVRDVQACAVTCRKWYNIAYNQVFS